MVIEELAYTLFLTRGLKYIHPSCVWVSFIEFGTSTKNSPGNHYRPNTAPKADIDLFSNTLHDIMDKINNEHKYGVLMGDMNVDLLKLNDHTRTGEYLDIFSHGFLPHCTEYATWDWAAEWLLQRLRTDWSRLRNDFVMIFYLFFTLWHRKGQFLR